MSRTSMFRANPQASSSPHWQGGQCPRRLAGADRRRRLADAAGGIADVVARMTAERLQTSLKQNFIVENQTGADGTVGPIASPRPRRTATR